MVLIDVDESQELLLVLECFLVHALCQEMLEVLHRGQGWSHVAQLREVRLASD